MKKIISAVCVTVLMAVSLSASSQLTNCAACGKPCKAPVVYS